MKRSKIKKANLEKINCHLTSPIFQTPHRKLQSVDKVDLPAEEKLVCVKVVNELGNKIV